MKPVLKFTPPISSFSDILQAFDKSKPLTGVQLNNLWNNESRLSSRKLDPVLHYYLKCFDRKPDKTLTLQIPANQMNKTTMLELKQGLWNLLHDNFTHVELDMSLGQYQKLKALGLDEFIFWQRWEYFTRSPLLAGSLPQLIYFQWGKIFAVVRFDPAAPGNMLTGNVHLYLEEMHKKNLYECVKEFNEHLKHDKALQMQMMQHYPQQELQAIHQGYQSPRPSFSRHQEEDKEDQ